MLTACSNVGVKEEDQAEVIQEEETFESFVKTVPLLEFPFEFGTNSEMPSIFETDSQFKPEGAAIIGRLESRDSKHFLISGYAADIWLPMLEVYDSEGEKLHAIELFDYAHCPLDANGFSKCTIANASIIYKETICNLYDSRVDLDTIFVDAL
ncbi:MAG: hypothetical protein ACFHU9_15570 [Fluviicola sp.]